MVNLANDEGWSPLHFAARQGSAPIAELLLEHGWAPPLAVDKVPAGVRVFTPRCRAEIDAVETRGYNPLLVAAALQQWHAAALLLRRGADHTVRDDGALGAKSALEHLPRLRDELR